jgi:hypothetical protein
MRSRLAQGRSVLAAASAVLMLSACVVFVAPPTGEQVSERAVRIEFSVCASGPEDGTCPDRGNSNDDADPDEQNELLLAFRVPRGTRAPEAITPVTSPVAGELEPNRSYKRRLTAQAPTPDGYKWAAYRSNVVTTDPEDVASFRVRFRLPRDFNRSNFKVRPVVGFFQPDAEHPAGTPIRCGPALYDRDIDPEHGERACIDSPDPATVEKSIKIPID